MGWDLARGLEVDTVVCLTHAVDEAHPTCERTNPKKIRARAARVTIFNMKTFQKQCPWNRRDFGWCDVFLKQFVFCIPN